MKYWNEIPKKRYDLRSEIQAFAIGSASTMNYCIKPTLPVRYKHILTGENRALTGENVYLSVNSRAVNDWLCKFDILDPGLPCKQCMLNVCSCQFQVLRPTRL